MNLSLPRAGLSDGDGFELIGVRVTKIPNYTVKNRNFDMCWPIVNNSVTEQYEMCAMYLHLFEETGGGNMSEMDLHDLLDRHVGNNAWFDAGSGAAD